MAYENISLKKDELRTFIIPTRGWKITPDFCTMDKEKGTILYKYFVDREFPDREYFVLIYKDKVIDMLLDGEEFVAPDTRKWKLISISIPEGLDKEEVLAELREALMIYGCDGSPFNKFSCGKAVTDF